MYDNRSVVDRPPGGMRARACRVDLHIHSTASDGVFTPEQIVDQAHAAGLRCIALTDHDTAAGVPRAQRRAQTLGLPFIPGGEYGAAFDTELHILAYGLDVHSTPFAGFIARQRAQRAERNEQMLSRLAAQGLHLDAPTGERLGGYGRMHMARSLVQMGVCTDIRTAFARYLGPDTPAYVATRRFCARELLEHLHACGAQTVLAHPSRMQLPPDRLRTLLVELRDGGLIGIEALYAGDTPAQLALYLRLAREMDLVITCGSDYHGNYYPAQKLGAAFADHDLPERTLEWLQALTGMEVFPRDGINP